MRAGDIVQFNVTAVNSPSDPEKGVYVFSRDPFTVPLESVGIVIEDAHPCQRNSRHFGCRGDEKCATVTFSEGCVHNCALRFLKKVC